MLSPHMGSLVAWLAKVSHIVPQWKKEGQTREDELRMLPALQAHCKWALGKRQCGWGLGVGGSVAKAER